MTFEDACSIKRIVTQAELQFLMDILAGVDKTQAIVNIGTYYGASGAALLLGMQKYNITGPLFCIGVFRYHNAGGPKTIPFRERTDIPWSESFIGEAKKNLAAFSIGKDVRYAECFSDDFDLSVVEGISVIFIDADHTVHGCLLDALKYSQKVVAGGLMLFHDFTSFGSVRKAIALFTQIRPDFKMTGLHGSIAIVEKRAT